MAARFRYSPASGPRNLRNQLPVVQAFDQTTNCGALLMRSGRSVAEQCGADVLVAKAPRDVVAIEDRREQANVRAAGRVEAGGTPFVHAFGFGELAQLLVSRRGILDDGQSVEVTTVASEGLLLVMNQAADIL